MEREVEELVPLFSVASGLGANTVAVRAYRWVGCPERSRELCGYVEDQPATMFVAGGCPNVEPLFSALRQRSRIRISSSNRLIASQSCRCEGQCAAAFGSLYEFRGGKPLGRAEAIGAD